MIAAAARWLAVLLGAFGLAVAVVRLGQRLPWHLIPARARDAGGMAAGVALLYGCARALLRR